MKKIFKKYYRLIIGILLIIFSFILIISSYQSNLNYFKKRIEDINNKYQYIKEEIIYIQDELEYLSELIEEINNKNIYLENKIDSGASGETTELYDLGEFKLTAYCPCKRCCGKWSYEVTGKESRTASGTIPTSKNTIAADTSILPFGTKVLINDLIYTVEDTGVKGKHIDIYMDSHETALEFGEQTTKVFLIK